MKKFLTLFLVLTLLLSNLILFNSCSSSKGSEGLEYELNSDGKSYCVLGKGECNASKIVIPSTYNDLPVTRVASKADFGTTWMLVNGKEVVYTVKSVTIPDSVTSIGASAFSSNFELTEVRIGSNVSYIGDYCFWFCTDLTNVYYEGTKAQWNQIVLGDSWCARSGITEVHCKDGDIKIIG